MTKSCTDPHRNLPRAFTLIEVLLSLALVSAVAAVGLQGYTQRMIDQNLAAEDAELAQMRLDIIRSMDSEDFTNINMFPANSNNLAIPTNFYENTEQVFSSTGAADWFSKLSKIRGYAVTTAAPTASSQPGVARILYNKFGRVRLLIPAAYETTEQRLLLVSLMARPDQLSIPAYDGSTNWFEAVWGADWGSRTNGLPAYLASLLSGNPAQLAAWNGDSLHGSQIYRLRVVRIVIPKYTITTSNSTTTNAFIYYNEGLDLAVCGAGAPFQAAGSILAGRVIKVFQGATQASAIETNQFTLRENTDIIIQSSN